ncbi:MAG: lysophospholipase [Bacteroidota bacterium]
MTHTTGTLDGSPALRWRHWRPEIGETAASVALIHGIHEHSGRYAYVASRLMLRGIEVHAVDLRGHGESEGPRGQIDDFGEYVQDADRFLQHVRRSAAEAPRFLMGHSMGGLVSERWWVSHDHSDFAGLILSSPALAVPKPNALLLAAAPLIDRFAPRLPVGKLNLEHLSRDVRVQAQYANDSLNTVKPIQARTGWQLYQTTQEHDPADSAFDRPMYLFHGTDDPITDPEGTRTLAAAARNHATLRLWDGLRHETMNEPEREDVIDAVADWILAQV